MQFVVGYWVVKNRMKLNVGKCKVIHFGGLKDNRTTYRLQGKNLEVVNKYLRVWIEKDHIGLDHIRYGMHCGKSLRNLDFSISNLWECQRILR